MLLTSQTDRNLGTKLKSSDPEFWHKNDIHALLNSFERARFVLLYSFLRTHCLRRREEIFEQGGALALAPGAKAYCRYYGIEDDDVSFMREDRGFFKTLAEKDFGPECQQCHLVGILVATGALGQWFWFALASCEGR